LVTAIVIPILIAYFYYLTKKERKKYVEQWMNVGKVREEAWIKGKVIDIQEKKERYYHHYFIYVIDVTLQDGHKKIVARIQIPATEQIEPPTFSHGEDIICYGEWKNKLFMFEKFTLLNHTTEV
jgi:hypothetical protein